MKLRLLIEGDRFFFLSIVCVQLLLGLDGCLDDLSMSLPAI